MKKLLIILFFLISPIIVNGVYEVTDPACTNEEKLSLRDEIANISYVLERYEDEGIYYKLEI